MIKKALRIGQLITNAHPTDVRLLFNAYGITAEPTGKTIMDAYLVYGKPFLMEIFNIGYKSVNPLSSATGDYDIETDKLNAYAANKVTAASQQSKDKKFTWETISGWFDTADGILTSGKGVYEGIAAIFNGGKPVDTGSGSATDAINLEYVNAKLAAQQAESANATKTYLLIGAGLLVAVLVGIMFLKRKK